MGEELTTQILKGLQEEGADVWHTAGGTKFPICQAEYGKKPQKTKPGCQRKRREC